MFRLFTKKLTEYSNHYIDWSRAAELVLSGDHHYSKDEIIVRGKIIVLTAVSAYVGASLNESNKTHCSNVSMAMISAVLGFIFWHAIIAVYPLYYKRRELKKDCDRLIQEINKKLDDNLMHISQASKDNIKQIILKEIMKLSLSDQNHGNASKTWGRRQSLLFELNDRLSPEYFNEAEWNPSFKAFYGI